jgi:hypothetical protein
MNFKLKLSQDISRTISTQLFLIEEYFGSKYDSNNLILLLLNFN